MWGFVMKFILFLLTALSVTSANAQETVTCEARSFAVKHDPLELVRYSKVHGAIIINQSDNSVTFVYSHLGKRFKKIYQIVSQNPNNLLAVEEFNEDKVSFLHYEKVTGNFNITYSTLPSRYILGTFTAGKCFI